MVLLKKVQLKVKETKTGMKEKDLKCRKQRHPIKCSHPERNEWSHITAKNKHMIEQWALISPYCSLPCSWHTSYVISPHPSAQHQLAAYRIPRLESLVVHHFSVGFLQTILLHSFFTILNTLLIPFIFSQLPTIIFRVM